MLKWALIFFVISLIAGFLGFSGVSGRDGGDREDYSSTLRLLIFLVFLVLALAVGGAVNLSLLGFGRPRPACLIASSLCSSQGASQTKSLG
ncbi:DUF1328 domain-containing protein (plasmid) [Sinorhizobium meliloti]|nr:DUF1328 domain-containing protein [Sinorhizobium meliloti]